MSTLAEIEKAIETLPASQLDSLAAWLHQRRLAQWRAAAAHDEAEDFKNGLETPERSAAARAWAKDAMGIVKLAPGETEDDVRMAYYKQKYRL